jgi:hypothetical protein
MPSKIAHETRILSELEIESVAGGTRSSIRPPLLVPASQVGYAIIDHVWTPHDSSWTLGEHDLP